MGMMGFMDNLEPIPMTGVLVESDVNLVIGPLTAGTFMADVLFARYEEVCRANKHVPASRQAFGAALRRRGGVRRVIKGKSAWYF